MSGARAVGGALDFRRFSDPIYILLNPISWRPDEPDSVIPEVVAPKGFVTDLASVPRIFWSLFRPDGNVWEWTEDCWHKNYRSAPKDGSARLDASGDDCESRVLRGGSWSYSADGVRPAFRFGDNRDSRIYGVGFRLARTL